MGWSSPEKERRPPERKSVRGSCGLEGRVSDIRAEREMRAPRNVHQILLAGVFVAGVVQGRV